jgi:hypothetical protein
MLDHYRSKFFFGNPMRIRGSIGYLNGILFVDLKIWEALELKCLS